MSKILLIFFVFFIGVIIADDTGVLISEEGEEHGKGIVVFESAKQKHISNENVNEAISHMINRTRSEGKVGVYFIVEAIHAHWIPMLMHHKFKIQTAYGDELKTKRQNIIIMKIQLSGDIQMMRPPAYTTIVVAAVVFDPRKGRIMLVKDADNHHFYKLPGGSLLPDENFEDGTSRILGTFGVPNATFHGVLEIKHGPGKGNPMRGKADMMIFSLFSSSEPEKETKHNNVEWHDRGIIDEKTIRTASNLAVLNAFDGFKKRWTHYIGSDASKMQDFQLIETDPVDPKRSDITRSVTYLLYRDHTTNHQEKNEVKHLKQLRKRDRKKAREHQ